MICRPPSTVSSLSAAVRRTRILPTLLLSLLSWSVVGAATPALAGETASWQTKVDPWILESATRFGSTEFLVYLEQQADLSEASRASTREEKGRLVFEILTDTATRTQQEVLTILAARDVEHRSFWIANMIWVRGDLQIVEALAVRPEIRRLVANPRVSLDKPLRDPEYRAAAIAAIGAGVAHTDAPTEFWENGFTGQGVVIGGQDTGYDWRHPALISSYRGWNGVEASHDYNWHDAIHSGGGICGPDSPEPCDDGRHGTHTMGIMVGDDGGANRIGLAPEARWIGCRNMDQGEGTPATYSECFEWFLAPTDLQGYNPDPSRAPDVINNSWTCPPSEGCTDPNALRAVVENTRAAGILVVAAAGNDGPDCSTIDSPIALYDATLTVGATDLDDEIAPFSGRGAVTADASGRRKPDLAAPGIGIRSSVPGAAYESLNGTSMAGPHVAGMAALALSAAECKRGRPTKLERHLLDSVLSRPAPALCGERSLSAVPNNTYGHGALRAVLPTCPRDGRVSGTTSRLSTSTVVCRNRSSRNAVRLPVDGANAWNCMARRLAASRGDRMVIKLKGSARESGELRGRLEGLETVRAVCNNRTTGSRVRIPMNGSRSWACEDAGPQVESGDRLKIVVHGRALADS